MNNSIVMLTDRFHCRVKIQAYTYFTFTSSFGTLREITKKDKTLEENDNQIPNLQFGLGQNT